MIFAAMTIFIIHIIMLSAGALDNQDMTLRLGWVANDMKLADQTMPKVYTIVMRNLNNITKREELSDYFNGFGEVMDLYVLLDSKNTTKNRGYCFVEYADETIANEIL